MVTETKMAARLLLDTAEGVMDLSEASGGAWEARLSFPHRQAGQRYWGGCCLTRDAAGQALYLAGSDGVWRSQDGGHTWQAASEGLRVPDVWGLEAHPARPGVVFAGTKPAAVFRSDDFGATWIETDLGPVVERDRWMYPLPPNTPQARAFAFDPRDPDWIYAGVEEGGVLLSQDGGRTWVDRSAGLTWSDLSPTPKADVHTVVVDPTDPDLVHAALGNGYHLSPDRGETWERRMTGLTPRYTRAIGVDRAQPGHLIVGTSEIPPVWMEHSPMAPQFADAGAKLFASFDFGASWEHLTDGVPECLPTIYTSIVQDAADHLRWYAVTIGGEVFVSQDNGTAWALAASGLPTILDLECLPCS